MVGLRTINGTSIECQAIFKRMLPACALLLAVLSTLYASAANERAIQPTNSPTTQPSAVAKWFSDLASTDPTTREHARDRLMRLTRKELPELQQILRTTSRAAPSQIIALRQIVQEIYLAGEPYEKDKEGGVEHGFLGIVMDAPLLEPHDQQQPNDNGQAPGIIVAGRFSGFGAARVLRDGDVIIASRNPDKVFNDADALKTVISGAEPGSTVRLEVLRQGQIIEVPLKLDPKPAEASTYDAAQVFRQERAEKFDQYWRDTFASLLKESVG